MKPEAFQHRKVGRLSIWARWLWNGMLHHADDDGRLIADHGHLRLLFFGYDHDVTDGKVGGWLGEIATAGLVILYTAEDGTPLAYFPDWHEHQRIDRPKPSTLPEPPPRTIAPLQRPAKRPHRRTGRPPFGRAHDAQAPEAHSDAPLASTTDRRDVVDESSTDRRVDRIGSDRDLDLETPPNPPAADAAASAEPPSVEAELFASNGQRAAKKPKRGEDDPPGFAEVWAAYPNHDGSRSEAVKRFRARPADVTVEMLLASIARWKESDRWARGFVVYLERWLAQRRWQSEPARASGLGLKTSGNLDAARRAAARIQGGTP